MLWIGGTGLGRVLLSSVAVFAAVINQLFWEFIILEFVGLLRTQYIYSRGSWAISVYIFINKFLLWINDQMVIPSVGLSSRPSWLRRVPQVWVGRSVNHCR
jgi:hypothetical protein